MSSWFDILILVILIGMNGAFALSEVALTCVEEVFATPNASFRRVEVSVFPTGGAQVRREPAPWCMQGQIRGWRHRQGSDG